MSRLSPIRRNRLRVLGLLALGISLLLAGMASGSVAGLSAHLSKSSFTASQASTVKLTCSAVPSAEGVGVGCTAAQVCPWV